MIATSPYSMLRRVSRAPLAFLGPIRRDMAEIARSKFRQAHDARLPQEMIDLLGEWTTAFEEKAP